MEDNFNEQSEKPRFIYKRNPVAAHNFQIFEFKEDKGDYEPVGDYTVIDTSEDPDLTEKKVMNLMILMNGRERLIDVSNLTEERVLFNIVEGNTEENIQKIVFRTYDGEGVSKENAVLVLEKGVLEYETETNSQ